MNSMDRREFLQLLAVAGACGMIPNASVSRSGLYDIPNYGDIRLVHITDTHAQLNPIYYREPHINLGFADAYARPPHLVGDALAKEFGLAKKIPGSLCFHVFGLY